MFKDKKCSKLSNKILKNGRTEEAGVDLTIVYRKTDGLKVNSYVLLFLKLF